MPAAEGGNGFMLGRSVSQLSRPTPTHRMLQCLVRFTAFLLCIRSLIFSFFFLDKNGVFSDNLRTIGNRIVRNRGNSTNGKEEEEPV